MDSPLINDRLSWPRRGRASERISVSGDRIPARRMPRHGAEAEFRVGERLEPANHADAFGAEHGQAKAVETALPLRPAWRSLWQAPAMIIGAVLVILGIRAAAQSRAPSFDESLAKAEL